MESLTGALGRKVGFSPTMWLRDARRMSRLVRDFASRRTPDAGTARLAEESRFAVVLIPWLGTPVPWFSLVCGLFMATRSQRVTFIIDDIPFGPNPVRFRFVIHCIRRVARVLRGQYEVLSLSAYRGHAAGSPICEPDIERLAELNAVWALRGETSTAGRLAYVERSKTQLRASAAAIAAVLQDERWEAILIPGGVYGSSGVWSTLARAAGIRVASFDSGGPTIAMLCASGIAAQLQDIPRALQMLKARPYAEGERRFIVESATTEIARRRSGTDKFASQLRSVQPLADSRFDGAVLLALNSSWDSAALGLHAIFENSAQWIVATAGFLLENTKSPVVVRQHPAERLAAARSTDDYRELLRPLLATHPRLHFIAAEDPVNSYELLERAAVVVVYASTFGTEAALNRKVVVTPSHSYYADLGFVWKATSLAQYHDHLLRAVAGDYAVTEAMQEDALCCYYLTQCCNWTVSPFCPEGFRVWSRMDLAELLRNEKVQLTVESFTRNVPAAYLNHLATRDQWGERP